MTAAADLFAKQGYRKTTVDEIVQQANISKGLFYHYFPNKQALYIHLYEVYVGLLSRSIREKVDTTETDLFKRLTQITHLRIAFVQDYPSLWEFLYSAYNEDHPDIAPHIKGKNETLLQESHTGTAAGIDWSKLKKGLTPERALEMVTWVAEGFVRKIAGSPEVEPAAYAEFDQYMEYLQTGMYEEG